MPSVFRSFTLGVLGLALISCQTTQRNLHFNETDFTPYAGTGSSVITGRAAGIFDQKTPRIANHLAVQLVPDNAYTREMEELALRQGEELRPRDPRFAHYIREARTDEDGHFTFTGIPAGRYYVTCRFTWPFRAKTSLDDRTIESDSLAQQTLYSKVIVGPGQEVRVERWNVSVWSSIPIQ